MKFRDNENTNRKMTTFKNHKLIEIPEDWKILYFKLRPFVWEPEEKPFLVEKSFKEPVESPTILSTKGYIFSRVYRDPLDHYDTLFLGSIKTTKPEIVYGYHNYGGYHMFFRPDFLEIIKYGGDIIRDSDVCFVTTKPCNQYGNISSYDVYDSQKDMHYALTTFYPFRKHNYYLRSRSQKN
jgi:hypothetical protein